MYTVGSKTPFIRKTDENGCFSKKKNQLSDIIKVEFRGDDEFENSLDLVPDKAKIVYLKDILDTYSRGDAFHYNLTDEEWRVLLKALREYAHSLQILIQKAKRHQETYEDIFGSKPQEVKTDWHPSMTQAEMFTELSDKMRSSK